MALYTQTTKVNLSIAHTIDMPIFNHFLKYQRAGKMKSTILDAILCFQKIQ